MSRIDMHISLDSSYFSLMEKMRAKKTRSAFIEELLDHKKEINSILDQLSAVKNNQKRIFALLLLIAEKCEVSNEKIKAIMFENKNNKEEL